MEFKPIKVTYFSRKQGVGYSIERVFKDIAENLPSSIKPTFHFKKSSNNSILFRFFHIFDAAFNQGEINHITGDIHYVSYLFPKKKSVITIHDCGTFFRFRGFKKSLYWFFWFWLPIKRCNYVIAISNSTKEEILRLIPSAENKLRVIENPISNIFQPNPSVFNKQKPRFLHIGSAKNKNLERHVEALKGLNCKLILIGNFSEVQIQILKNSKLDFMIFSNLNDSEILEQYQLSDIVLFASTYEGFGLPIIEAQAVGRPVITSDLMPMINVAGGAALLVNPLNVLSIREGVEKIISDDIFRANLINLGFNNVKRFNSKNIASQYADLYLEIASKNLNN